VTTTEERTTHVALYSLFQTVGFILGPAIQAALTPVGTQGFDEGSDFVVNMYTATGWVIKARLQGAGAVCDDNRNSATACKFLAKYQTGCSCDWHDVDKSIPTRT
jgi:hypothetical protein